ncbi:DUF4185 domain-containing protein, partial [candidate division KSB1 bacterium]
LAMRIGINWALSLRFRGQLWRISRTGFLFASLAVAAQTVATGNPPYPPSPVIAGLTIDWRSHQRGAQGSDNFQLTWADDGHLYGAWGDGGGFGGTNSDGRVGLGVARVEGPGSQPMGYNVWGGKRPENEASFDGKSWGMICVDGILYMWVVPDKPDTGGERNHFAYIQMARSRDHGRTWEKQENWRFSMSEQLTIPTFLNFGKNNGGARDGYVYSYFIHPTGNRIESGSLTVNKPGRLYLARAKADGMFENKEAFEFFRGLDSEGSPRWGGINEKRAVFKDTNGVGWCLSACYNQGLGRYLLCTEHSASSTGMMGIFDAPEPWGPWSVVRYYDESDYFGKSRVVQNVFFLSFPTKWMNPDGSGFTMVFTGAGLGKNNDSFNAVGGEFNLRP